MNYDPVMVVFRDGPYDNIAVGLPRPLPYALLMRCVITVEPLRMMAPAPIGAYVLRDDEKCPHATYDWRPQ